MKKWKKNETVRKMKISKKWKKHLEISSFYTSVLKIMIICYNVLEIWCMTVVIVIFHFGLFFAFLPPPNNPKTKNFKKTKKLEGDLLWLFKNYLQNCEQRVVLNSQILQWRKINPGVTQGLVLGPLLFFIYINDLYLVI